MVRAFRSWTINRRRKNSVRNLWYGTQTRLVRGIYVCVSIWYPLIYNEVWCHCKPRFRHCLIQHSLMREINSNVLYLSPTDKWLSLIRIATKARSFTGTRFQCYSGKKKTVEKYNQNRSRRPSYSVQVTKGTYGVQSELSNRKTVWSSWYLNETKLSLKTFFFCKQI